jgi:hypothetical protein
VFSDSSLLIPRESLNHYLVSAPAIHCFDISRYTAVGVVAAILRRFCLLISPIVSRQFDDA